MEAVVFKNHVALTADRAWLARKHVPGVKVFGVVWFPTFDADHHVRHAGTAPSGASLKCLTWLSASKVGSHTMRP